MSTHLDNDDGDGALSLVATVLILAVIGLICLTLAQL
jgi:hypothetical protein